MQRKWWDIDRGSLEKLGDFVRKFRNQRDCFSVRYHTTWSSVVVDLVGHFSSGVGSLCAFGQVATPLCTPIVRALVIQSPPYRNAIIIFLSLEFNSNSRSTVLDTLLTSSASSIVGGGRRGDEKMGSNPNSKRIGNRPISDHGGIRLKQQCRNSLHHNRLQCILRHCVASSRGGVPESADAPLGPAPLPSAKSSLSSQVFLEDALAVRRARWGRVASQMGRASVDHPLRMDSSPGWGATSFDEGIEQRCQLFVPSPALCASYLFRLHRWPYSARTPRPSRALPQSHQSGLLIDSPWAQAGMGRMPKSPPAGNRFPMLQEWDPLPWRHEPLLVSSDCAITISLRKSHRLFTVVAAEPFIRQPLHSGEKGETRDAEPEAHDKGRVANSFVASRHHTHGSHRSCFCTTAHSWLKCTISGPSASCFFDSMAESMLTSFFEQTHRGWKTRFEVLPAVQSSNS
ncbi:hypothetical protein C8R45DRAFT_926515 [Mycena sanguinolenta]|nr:hypothetical protein C8R45DRAFT_926515 [Mycena sanguinolenta]